MDLPWSLVFHNYRSRFDQRVVLYNVAQKLNVVETDRNHKIQVFHAVLDITDVTSLTSEGFIASSLLAPMNSTNKLSS